MTRDLGPRLRVILTSCPAGLAAAARDPRALYEELESILVACAEYGLSIRDALLIGQDGVSA